MARRSNDTTVAIAIQPVADVFTDPATAYMPVSQLRLTIEGVTITNDEYTGTIIKNADDVVGKRATLAYNVKMRGPGGSSPPAANTFLPGIILQAAKFTELRTAAAIPVAAEAGSAGTTNSLTLGSGAAATAEIYKGMAIMLASMGTSDKQRMTAIRSYSAGKVATFVETFGGAVGGNYQIPPQLGYMRDVSSADPILVSQKVWIGGVRYDCKNMRLSSCQIVVPTSTKDTPAYPEIQVTWTLDIDATADEGAPAITPLGAIPFYKDGKGFFTGKAIGLQTFTVDLGIGVEYPPNPNKVDGVDAAEIVSGTARITMTRQAYLKATLDSLALADAQTQQPFFAQWGSAGGKMIQVVVPDGRPNYASPDTGGNIILENGDLMIDAFSRGVCINFPYY